MYIVKRALYLDQIQKAFNTHPVVALLGPRQSGKTTLSREYIEKNRLESQVHLFDLEDPTDLLLLENPKTALESLEGLIIIDEIQRIPNLFPILRVLVDQPDKNRQFLILGSASRDLIRQSSETLAGRIAYLEIAPFSLNEIPNISELWLKGGFPKSFLAQSIEDSGFWRQQYISTFLERDLPALGIRIASMALRRFWTMLAHYHGQIYNSSEIGQSLGISDTTARYYLDILVGSFMIRQLSPWTVNIKKRQVKSPKIYFRDSGIFHTLIGIENSDDLLHNPKLGASWEGFALEQVTRIHQAESNECYFWGIHGQAELDLLIFQKGKFKGFEFKYSDAPRLTHSMKLALEHLELDTLEVIYPGSKNYQLDDKVFVKSLKSYQA